MYENAQIHMYHPVCQWYIGISNRKIATDNHYFYYVSDNRTWEWRRFSGGRGAFSRVGAYSILQSNKINFQGLI